MSLTKFAARQRTVGVFRLSHLSILSLALLAGGPARAQEPNMWDKMMSSVGMGGKPASATPAAPAPAAPAPAAAAPAPAAAAQPATVKQPGMFDNMLGAVGLGGRPEGSAIDYTERQKLAVPQQRNLPPPNPAPEHMVAKPADTEEALTKPPGDYMEKVKGADGQVSGLRENDVAKEKKFLNFF